MTLDDIKALPVDERADLIEAVQIKQLYLGAILAEKVINVKKDIKTGEIIQELLTYKDYYLVQVEINKLGFHLNYIFHRYV